MGDRHFTVICFFVLLFELNAAPADMVADVDVAVKVPVERPPSGMSGAYTSEGTSSLYSYMPKPSFSAFQQLGSDYWKSISSNINAAVNRGTGYVEDGIRQGGKYVEEGIRKGGKYVEEGLEAGLGSMLYLGAKTKEGLKENTAKGLQTSADLSDTVNDYRRQALRGYAYYTNMYIEKLNELLDQGNEMYKKQAYSMANSIHGQSQPDFQDIELV